MVNVLAFIMDVISLTYIDFVVYSHILGHYHGQCLGLHHGQWHGRHHGCHKSCRSWQLCRAVNHDSGRSPARRLRHIMLCHQQEDYDGDHDDCDDHRNNDNYYYEDHDFGRFCVLQPDLFEQKEISNLFQMHFKLLRFFCSGRDTTTD